MTPEQITLVQQSFSKVAPISEAASVLFYDRLFEVAPSVRAMFPEDMTEQRKKLMGMLAAVVGGLSNLESILPAASALAKRHVGYGAKAEHCGPIGDDGDEVGARGVQRGAGRIAHDLFARGGDTRRVCQREVALVGELLRRQYGDLARRRAPVVFQGVLFQRLIHEAIL